VERREYDRYGGPEVVQLRPFTLTKRQADEIVVRLAAPPARSAKPLYKSLKTSALSSSVAWALNRQRTGHRSD